MTRSLHKNSDGVYIYYGYWDWTDGKWDQYVDETDIFAFRSTKDLTSRISAYIYSYSNFGIEYPNKVARRDWNADGVSFNVHDTWGYLWGGAVDYPTDNGFGMFTFKGPTGAEIYSHFEHNYKKSVISVSGEIDWVELKNSFFKVHYTTEPTRWHTPSNPLTL